MIRGIAMYFVWDRTAESKAPPGELDNRFRIRHVRPETGARTDAIMSSGPRTDRLALVDVSIEWSSAQGKLAASTETERWAHSVITRPRVCARDTA